MSLMLTRNPILSNPENSHASCPLMWQTEAKMITTEDQNYIELKQTSNCRKDVEIAMMGMLTNLQKHGWSAAELALALADASEELVMLIASKTLRPN